ncbi:MAG TPA: DUF983 domain-containing protein [Dehalococcoidia bacterium]|nr:DUF983 domain-containing protein [Dehalococcoidia bacterium]
MNRTLTHFWRALGLRCPNCGTRPIFCSWYKMVDVCPGCGLRLEEREPGYFTGAIVTNYFIAIGWFVVLLVAAIILSESIPVWTVVQWGAVAIAIASPLIFWPFSKTLWVALDISLRPVQPEDIAHSGSSSGLERRVESHRD